MLGNDLRTEAISGLEEAVPHTFGVKAQWVRAADVFFVGPVMILGAALLPPVYVVTRLALLGMGIATIYYNARNYALIEQR